MVHLDKTKIIIVGLIAIIIILACVIGVSYYKSYTVRQQQAIYTIGYQQAILDVINASDKCQVVPLKAGNQTFGFVDVSCLQQKSSVQTAPQGNIT